ncbi:MAG: ThuA domain-containing protein [Verrucomicrobia bacterium]|nr:ThuA domain-containing protein [Verrucomicrobiota bacterium]
MNRTRAFLSVAAALAIAWAAFPCQLSSAESAPGGWSRSPGKRILYFTKSSGFEHSVVKRPASGDLSHSEKVLTDLGRQHGFAVTCTKDGRIFSSPDLASFDVFVFYTSGMLTEPGTDKQPPMTPEGKQALLDAIRRGKGFVGVHAANDSFHVQPDPSDKSSRFKAYGDKVDPFIAMLGGEFIRHGPQQVATMRVADPRFPGLDGVPERFDSLDEWYTFKDFAPDLHVILVQETRGMKGIDYQRAPFPATWARRHGQGRVFYTSMGHREDVWTHPRFQRILLGGLGWAAGNVDADVPATIDTVTPGHREIQPETEPKP